MSLQGLGAINQRSKGCLRPAPRLNPTGKGTGLLRQQLAVKETKALGEASRVAWRTADWGTEADGELWESHSVPMVTSIRAILPCNEPL